MDSPLSAVSKTPTPPPKSSSSSRPPTASSAKQQPAEEATSPHKAQDELVQQSSPRRSGRERKRPATALMSEDELTQDAPAPKKTVKAPRNGESSGAGAKTARRAPLRGNFSPDYILKNPRSILTNKKKIRLNCLLGKAAAWDALDRAEQVQLIRLLPGYHDLEWPEDQPVPNMPGAEMKNNSTLKGACSRFQDDLADGRYTDTWLQKAQNAMKQRIKGTFDDWKEREKEAFWGQKQKVNWDALAGDSSKYKLSDLVKAGLFERDDIWRFEITRGTSKRTGQAKMVKEALITAVDTDTGTLTFKFPPGQHETAKDDYEEGEMEVEFQNCDNPTPLLVKMMEKDGRVDANQRMNNAWKLVRIFRRNQDLGALFDLRERHAVKAK